MTRNGTDAEFFSPPNQQRTISKSKMLDGKRGAGDLASQSVNLACAWNAQMSQPTNKGRKTRMKTISKPTADEKRSILKSLGWRRTDRACGANNSTELWVRPGLTKTGFQYLGVSLRTAWRNVNE